MPRLIIRLAAIILCDVAATPAAAQPVTVGVSYTTDLVTNLSGGLDRGMAWLGRADVTLEAGDPLFGIEGARLFVDIIYTHGPDFSGRHVGDAQVVSNVQGDGVARPYEAFVELGFGGGGRAKMGLVDLNTEFDVQSVGAFFTGSSHGIGIDFSQTGAGGPSIFPVTSAAVMLAWEGKGWTARAGLFDAVAGDPDRPTRFRLTYPGQHGSLLVAEADAKISGSVQVQLGTWAYTAAQPIIDDPNTNALGSKGAFGQIELSLAEAPDGDKLESWIRLGTADSRSNRVTFYAGGGLTYGSEKARVGFAVAHARQSGRAARFFTVDEAPQLRAETSFELGYARRVTDFLIVQPVLHYIVNPGWRRDVADAFVAGLRLSFALES